MILHFKDEDYGVSIGILAVILLANSPQIGHSSGFLFSLSAQQTDFRAENPIERVLVKEKSKETT